jgi:diguanylate cyclase (GGDEF)-like protein/PAS domain S-box-containing protein
VRTMLEIDRLRDGAGATPAAGGGLAVRALAEAVADPMLVCDDAGVLLAASRSALRMFDRVEGDAVGGPLMRLLPNLVDPAAARASTGGRPREMLGRRADGTAFPVTVTIGEGAVAGGVRLFVAMLRDGGERRAVEEMAVRAATHDLLTGCLNRHGFLEAVARRIHEDAAMALVTADIDRFRDLNQTYGDREGDACLRVFAVRLEKAMPAGSLIARIAGDEFAALVPLSAGADADRLLEAALSAGEGEVDLGGHRVGLRCTVGVVVADRSIREPGELLAKAQLALQSAKRRGGGAGEVYTPSLAASANRRAQLKLHLAQAVVRGEFSLAFQPIVDAGGRIVAAETLLRWTHTALGPVSPAEFIPLAEETGLIIPITGWLLREVAAQMAAWRGGGVGPARIYVNVSGQSLVADTLVDQVSEILGADPDLAPRLGIEITEQAAVSDFDAAVRMVRRLADMGVRTAIDDFGTGYSSLSYLQRLPVHALKIDRSFVDGLPDDHRNAALVRAAVGIAHGLGLDVVAEGVETEAQRRYLVGIGCDRLQGYLFSAPRPAEQFAAVLAAGVHRPAARPARGGG